MASNAMATVMAPKRGQNLAHVPLLVRHLLAELFGHALPVARVSLRDDRDGGVVTIRMNPAPPEFIQQFLSQALIVLDDVLEPEICVLGLFRSHRRLRRVRDVERHPFQRIEGMVGPLLEHRGQLVGADSAVDGEVALQTFLL